MISSLFFFCILANICASCSLHPSCDPLVLLSFYLGKEPCLVMSVVSCKGQQGLLRWTVSGAMRYIDDINCNICSIELYLYLPNCPHFVGSLLVGVLPIDVDKRLYRCNQVSAFIVLPFRAILFWAPGSVVLAYVTSAKLAMGRFL